MSTLAVTKNGGRMPLFFDDFFKPWNEWFDNTAWAERSFNVPAVNITEHDNEFMVSLAVPGMKKSDFKIDIEGNMLTISSEKEETKEEKEKKFTRKEYNYSSFNRSFTLPEEVNKEKIDATYEDGLLKISLPRKAEVKKLQVKHVAVK